MLRSVKARLREMGRLSPEIEYRISEFERICVSEIHSDVLRSSTIDYLENQAPLEFFTAPASSSGRTHPDWQSLPGGILLNTTECCIAADRKLRMYPELTTDIAEPKEEAHDIVYVATILSDTFKTEDAGKRSTQFSHHDTATKAWRTTAQKHGISPVMTERIASAIQWHLGRFTPGWPPNKDPRELNVLDFIVHELDMDFSNRRLSEVFQRRLGDISDSAPSTFIEKEFEVAASYFTHVEDKLNNLLVFFATLLLGVITASYYISSSDTFKTLSFCRTPRAFLMGLLLMAFTIISVVFIGVYTELRVRKIRMLEEMASVRAYEIDAARRKGIDIHKAITMVASVSECPPYLRRPSEDWYTLLLMTISSASSFATSVPFWTFWIVIASGVDPIPHRNVVWLVEGLVAFMLAGYIEFAWFTRFCYQLDLERETNFSGADYVFFPKHGSSFPWLLRPLDTLAKWIEKRHRQATEQLPTTK